MWRQARLELAKWTQTFQVQWATYLAYKANFLLLFIGPTLVFFFVKYNVWSSIYDLENLTSIRGYNRGQMLEYQAWVMLVSFLAQGFRGANLSEDIRLGRISAYLIYPFSFWQYHAAGFLAFQLIHLFIALGTLGTILAVGLVSQPSLVTLAQGFSFSLLVGFFWFTITFIIGLGAFWLEETWTLRVIFINIATFFSGGILPLEIFPDWLQTLLAWTPFPLITYAPVRMFMGEYSGSFAGATLLLLFWSILTLLLAQWIWSRGIRLYTAAGM